MSEGHFVLLCLIVFTLWAMNIIRLVPRSEKQAEKELLKTILRDSNKGIFK